MIEDYADYYSNNFSTLDFFNYLDFNNSVLNTSYYASDIMPNISVLDDQHTNISGYTDESLFSASLCSYDIYTAGSSNALSLYDVIGVLNQFNDFLKLHDPISLLPGVSAQRGGAAAVRMPVCTTPTYSTPTFGSVGSSNFGSAANDNNQFISPPSFTPQSSYIPPLQSSSYGSNSYGASNSYGYNSYGYASPPGYQATPSFNPPVIGDLSSINTYDIFKKPVDPYSYDSMSSIGGFKSNNDKDLYGYHKPYFELIYGDSYSSSSYSSKKYAEDSIFPKRSLLESYKASMDYMQSQKDALDPSWSKNENLSSIENAYSHWSRHKSDFPDLNNAKEYVDFAKDFISNPRKDSLQSVRPNGDKK